MPYLAVSMDLLLDGHPIASGLPVKPMVAAESTAPQLYYGNNLKLAQRGTYQVFIRLQPSALLSKDQPQAASSTWSSADDHRSGGSRAQR